MGGILDTWVTVFQSDTKSVDQGNRKATQSADELVDSLTKADRIAERTGDSMVEMLTTAATAFTGFLAAKAGIMGVFESAETIVALNQTAEALGETIENVDAFGKAAVVMGGDADGARDSLTDLAEKMGEAMSDVESSAAKSFKSLGVNLKDTEGKTKGAVEGMLDLAGAMEKLPKPEAIFKIKELGITDNRTVEMILKGRKELERLLDKQKQMGVVTKANAEEAVKFKAAWGELSSGFERAGTSISTKLMPYFTKAMEVLGVGFDWLQDHKDLVVGFFIAVGAAVAVFYVPPMLAAAAATLAATWPILAIGAAIAIGAAAFALIYDDIMNFMDGNDSMIGQMAEKYPLVKTLIEGIGTAFKFLGDLANEAWRMITVGFTQMLNFITAGIKQIAAGVSTVAEFFGIGGESDPEQAGPKEPVGRARQSGSGQDASDVPSNSTIPQGANESVRQGQKQLAQAAASPLNATSSNAITNSNTNSKVENNLSIGELNVNAPQATDAAGVAQASTSAFDKQLKSMQESSANGRER